MFKKKKQIELTEEQKDVYKRQVLFFVKVGTAYFDYKKHGQFEFTAPAILFACLIFTLTAPLRCV